MPNNTTETPTVSAPNFSESSAGCYLQNPWDALNSCAFPQAADATAGSGTLFGLLLGVTIIGSAWYATDSVGAAGGLLILLGGALFPMVPQSFHGMGWSLVFVGIAAAFWGVATRLVLDPSTQEGL